MKQLKYPSIARVLTGVVLFAGLVFATSNAQAQVINLNSGLDNSNNLIAGGLNDVHWNVYDGNTGVFVTQAVVMSDGNLPGGAWIPNGPNSKWISTADSINPNPGGATNLYLDYRATFTLTATEAAKANLTGQWSVDDTGWAGFLNGNNLGTSSPTGQWGFWHPFAAGSGFVAGTNSLDFFVTQQDNAFDAVRIEATVTSVPEPAPAAVLMIGVLGLVSLAVVRRKRSAN